MAPHWTNSWMTGALIVVGRELSHSMCQIECFIYAVFSFIMTQNASF